MQALVDPVLKRKYDGHYNGESEWRRLCAIDKVQHVIDLCEPRPDSVLEVGAGEGSVLAQLDSLSFATRLYGLEISESGVEAIRTRGIERLVEARRFDGYVTPFPDRFFDLVIATHVLEHVEHERVFLQELRRIGRAVFVEVPLEDTIRVDANISNDIGHINFYRRETVLALLRSVGLTPLRWRVYDYSLAVARYHGGLLKGSMKHFARSSLLRVAPRVAEKLFTYHLAVLAK